MTNLLKTYYTEKTRSLKPITSAKCAVELFLLPLSWRLSCSQLLLSCYFNNCSSAIRRIIFQPTVPPLINFSVFKIRAFLNPIGVEKWKLFHFKWISPKLNVYFSISIRTQIGLNVFPLFKKDFSCRNLAFSRFKQKKAWNVKVFHIWFLRNHLQV